MRYGVVRFSLILFWNPNVDHDSVEGLFSMSLLPRKHSPDNSPDVVVRSSRMSWSFFLVAKRTRFQLPLLGRDLRPVFSTFGHSSKSFSEANGFRVDNPGGLKDDLFGRHSSSRLDKECECSSFLVIAVCRG